MDRRESPMSRTVPTVITGVVTGALFSLMAVGTRGYSFLPAFVITSGFVAGIGILVNKACDRFLKSGQDR